MKKTFTKTAVVLGASLLGLSSLAVAVPPPDVVTKCNANNAYQIHHWYMLGGGPTTIYYQVGNYSNPNGPWSFTQITAQQYSAACPFVAPPLLVEHYATVLDIGDLAPTPGPIKPMKEIQQIRKRQ